MIAVPRGTTEPGLRVTYSPISCRHVGNQADKRCSERRARKGVGVRIPLSAPRINLKLCGVVSASHEET